MAIKEFEKTYIECRMFILGERNVGKKSFINRILSLPSTSIIRNYEAEKEFNKMIEDFAKKIIEEEDFMKQSDKDQFRGIRSKNETVTLGNTSSANKKLQTESKDVTSSKEKEKNKSIETNKTINAGYKINFLPSKIAKSKIYHRPPIPEFPSKLFNVFKTKMVFKPYFIPPAEDLLFDSKEKDEEDSDYEFEKEQRLTMKGVKKDINKIMNLKKTIIEMDNLGGYKIYVYYLFIFLYDMADYTSFETLIKYFDRLEAKYEITSDENLLACVIGNKKDRNISFTEEQSKTLNEFINKYNLKHYEISTKPFFNFSKFYTQLIIDNFGPMHEAFEENNFTEELKKVVENRSNFPKALRTTLVGNEENPGPDYDLNIYSFNSMKELRDTLMNKKTRFNKKIFVNKQGPIIYNSKSAKDILNTDNKEKKSLMYISNGGILNKPITGYTFGVTEGRLNLVKSRRDLMIQRNKILTESLEGSFPLNVKMSTASYKPESYFDEASARKSQFLSRRIIERQKKLEKIEKIHKNNLDKITAEKDTQKNLLIPKMRRSSSAPDLILTSVNKQRYYEVVYGKNKDYLDKFNKRRLEIEKEKIKEEKERMKLIDEEREKQKQLEIEKEIERKKEIQRKEKFRLRMNTTRSPIEYKITVQKSNYPIIKDEFEILLEKNKKRSQMMPKEFKPRFEEIKKEKINNPYNDQEIWKKWENNKKKISDKGHLKMFLDKRKKKEKEQRMNALNLEKQNDEIRKLRREILIEKGYEDPFKIKEINYSQVEEAAPKYSLKGRNIPREKENTDDVGNFLLGQDKEIIDYIKNLQMNRPLPNINYVKPNLPSVIFSKAERFLNYNKSYEGSDDLFKDGIFAPKTQEDFNIKGTFSQDEKRSLAKKEQSPSPCEYKIKSSFEIIAEKGKAISDLRKRIKRNEEIEKENRIKFIMAKTQKENEKVKDNESNSNIKNFS